MYLYTNPYLDNKFAFFEITKPLNCGIEFMHSQGEIFTEANLTFKIASEI